MTDWYGVRDYFEQREASRAEYDFATEEAVYDIIDTDPQREERRMRFRMTLELDAVDAQHAEDICGWLTLQLRKQMVVYGDVVLEDAEGVVV